MAKKELKQVVKLVVPAKQANPAPPIGPALGAAGVNISEFCKQFNDKTANMEPGMPIPCVISVFTDRSFDFIMKLPPVSYFIKKVLKLKSGAKKPGTETVGTITLDQVKKIAEEKLPDLNCADIEAAVNIICGQCLSMGVNVEGE